MRSAFDSKFRSGFPVLEMGVWEIFQNLNTSKATLWPSHWNIYTLLYRLMLISIKLIQLVRLPLIRTWSLTECGGWQSFIRNYGQKMSVTRRGAGLRGSLFSVLKFNTLSDHVSKDTLSIKFDLHWFSDNQWDSRAGWAHMQPLQVKSHLHNDFSNKSISVGSEVSQWACEVKGHPIQTARIKLLVGDRFYENSVFISFRLSNTVSSKTVRRFRATRLHYLTPISLKENPGVSRLFRYAAFWLVGWTQTFSVSKILSFRKWNEHRETKVFFPCRLAYLTRDIIDLAMRCLLRVRI